MNTHTSPRQTLSYLRTLFEQFNIGPKSKLGQNFLIDLNLLDLLADSAELTSEDLVLEVGTGTGSLTTRLLEWAGAVVSVEIDRGFAEMVHNLLDEQDKLTLLHADVLRTKNELNSEVIDVVRTKLAQPDIERFKLVANLPYAVATPVISNFLMTDLPIERLVVTVQWEIGERLAAEPNTSPYGALAILVQSVAEVEIVRRLSPKVFWPRPKVDSAIVRITPNAERRAEVGDVCAFRDFLRGLYVNRRKNLRGALLGLPFNQGQWTKPDIDAKLAELGIDSTRRAETLDRHEHLRLSRLFIPTKKEEI